MSKQIDWDTYSKLISSKYRLDIFLILSKNSLSPKQISLKTKISISHVSRTLKELEELNLVKCLTSEKIKKGKIFAISDESSIYLEEITRNLINKD
ncbi:MAG: winged helix-turn-helix transcriptional regulator [Candidatus Lokiarchaeota archaeon]|nr:winged helix-turn-helix transcriptional regulator [Candidatus Lokiarchaeota archaeon]